MVGKSCPVIIAHFEKWPSSRFADIPALPRSREDPPRSPPRGNGVRSRRVGHDPRSRNAQFALGKYTELFKTHDNHPQHGSTGAQFSLVHGIRTSQFTYNTCDMHFFMSRPNNGTELLLENSARSAALPPHEIFLFSFSGCGESLGRSEHALLSFFSLARTSRLCSSRL